ncbi:MAG: threonine ammonia-lyase [Planctomycetes bacterium]|nr:threonine ammonia-lyase [Planctomycetota bacterium]
MVTLKDVEQAEKALEHVVRPTPLILSYTLSDFMGREVYLKPESLQRTGSFKIRGAYNRMLKIPEAERRHGVLAASAGNHAQGVALAAKVLGIPATVVMPEDTAIVKVERARGYGAEVVLVKGDFEAARARTEELRAARGATVIPTYDDPDVIAGQGTVGLEIIRDGGGDIDEVLVPAGGGGLLAGVAAAVKGLSPRTRVVGVQAEGCASIVASLAKGERVRVPKARTFAEGIAVPMVGEHPLEIIRALVDEVMTVSDEAIARAMVTLMEKSKLVLEAAGAAGAAALLEGEKPPGRGKVVVILSGGNVDINLLQRVIERGLVAEGRYVRITVRMPDRPGNLALILAVVAAHGGNVVDVEHDRGGWRVSLGEVKASLLVELRESGAGPRILDAVRASGFDASLLGAPEYARARVKGLTPGSEEDGEDAEGALS